MKYNYPLFKVHINSEDALLNLKKVFDSGFLNEGEQVTEFKQELEKYFDHENVIPLNSCTSALTLSLILAGVGEDSEVIVPSMTCVASVTPIHNVGAKVVWADIDEQTGNICVEDVKDKITSKTKAVLCVNWAGLPCGLETLHELCKKNDIKLIQDAAHSFGSLYKSKHVCHFADFTCYSFQAIKHITCGDGGALICSDKEDYNRAKKLKWFGFDRDGCKDEKGEWKGQRWSVDINESGYKFYMNNVSAAIGLSQIKSMDDVVSKHKRNANLYHVQFAGNKRIKPLVFPKQSDPAYWVYTLLVDGNRDEIISKLNAMGIGAALVHVPCHIYTCFEESLCDLPGTNKFYENQISLPCGWWLEPKDIENIATELKSML